MQKCKVVENFTVLELNSLGELRTHEEDDCFDVSQYTGEVLEVWKERSDGFLFVYGCRLEIGYWVHPRLVTKITEE